MKKPTISPEPKKLATEFLHQSKGRKKIANLKKKKVSLAYLKVPKIQVKVWADEKPSFFRKRWHLTVFHAQALNRRAFKLFLRDST